MLCVMENQIHCRFGSAFGMRLDAPDREARVKQQSDLRIRQLCLCQRFTLGTQGRDLYISFYIKSDYQSIIRVLEGMRWIVWDVVSYGTLF